jgi:hypothetical protein
MALRTPFEASRIGTAVSGSQLNLLTASAILVIYVESWVRASLATTILPLLIGIATTLVETANERSWRKLMSLIMPEVFDELLTKT